MSKRGVLVKCLWMSKSRCVFQFFGGWMTSRGQCPRGWWCLWMSKSGCVFQFFGGRMTSRGQCPRVCVCFTPPPLQEILYPRLHRYKLNRYILQYVCFFFVDLKQSIWGFCSNHSVIVHHDCHVYGWLSQGTLPRQVALQSSDTHRERAAL